MRGVAAQKKRLTSADSVESLQGVFNPTLTGTVLLKNHAASAASNQCAAAH